MPILFEPTDKAIQYHRKNLDRKLGKTLKFSPGSGVTTFLAGLVTGFIILPIVLPIIGYQVTSRWGPPSR